MKRCLDEAVLQAYLDGELSGDAALETQAHLAACSQCAAALNAAEGEGAFLAAAFAPDDSVNVPTVQLRARIDAAVARLDAQPETNARPSGGWNFGALLASFTSLLTFTPQRAAGFAGMLSCVVLAALFFSIQKPSPAPNSPAQEEHMAFVTQPPAQPKDGSANVEVKDAPTAPTPEINRSGVPIQVAKFNRPHASKPRVKAAPVASSLAAPVASKAQPLPGEKDYEQAIASLSTAISHGGDAVLKPQVRAQYERNLAVLDKAIEETRLVARRNPKDKDAVDFLMSAYQSKIELLTTVADQAQVAALGR
ncbi:MAG: zf-HC2 domain-containing protein [Acidobacteria bacterium]|nr:zf-HC2 domain-containing protein [Acidobacteriota bacterium]